MITRRLCLICDAFYSPFDAEQVKTHEHPDPQRGLFREALLKSGLPYERWIVETREGQNWNNRKYR